MPTFTDFKLHDITSGPDDPNREPLNMHFPAGSVEFFAGNSRFLTKRLWGAANEPPFFHHGKFTTMRQAILAHHGEADASRAAFEALSDYERDSIIEFLKTLQVLPPGTQNRIVDENYRRRRWPPLRHHDATVIDGDDGRRRRRRIGPAGAATETDRPTGDECADVR